MRNEIVIYTSGCDEYPTRMNKIEWRKKKKKKIETAIPPRGVQLYGRPHLADFSATRASRRLSG